MYYAVSYPRLVLAVVIQASVLMAIPARSDLVALYTFEQGIVNDVQAKVGAHEGSVYDGLPSGDGLLLSTDVSGVNGGSQSLSFDGDADYMDAPISAINPFHGYQTQDYSVTAWFKSNASAGTRVIISSSIDDRGDMTFLVVESGQLELDYNWRGNVRAGGGLHDGNWHFAAVVYSATANVFRVYMDNLLAPSTKTIDSSVSDPSLLTVRIGDTRNTDYGGVPVVGPDGPGDWQGLLDDVAIFDHALDLSELTQIHVGDFSD
jgi:hypothetical protein